MEAQSPDNETKTNPGQYLPDILGRKAQHYLN